MNRKLPLQHLNVVTTDLKELKELHKYETLLGYSLKGRTKRSTSSFRLSTLHIRLILA